MSDSSSGGRFTEDRIPFAGIEEALEDLVELYGGEMTERQERVAEVHPPAAPRRLDGWGSGVHRFLGTGRRRTTRPSR